MPRLWSAVPTFPLRLVASLLMLHRLPVFRFFFVGPSSSIIDVAELLTVRCGGVRDFSCAWGMDRLISW